MSDAAITAICAGAANIFIALLGFLTLWVKLKYGTQKAAERAAENAAVVEKKLDANTLVTTETKEAVSNGALSSYEARFTEHDARIAALEVKVDAVSKNVDTVSKNVDSTRHELRGSLQTVMNKLDLMAARAQTGVQKP